MAKPKALADAEGGFAAHDCQIYGGGLLSSIGETHYVYSTVPQRRAFSLMDVLRTPYRIDIMQPIYYVLDTIESLYAISEMDIMSYVHQAQALGLFAPLYPPKELSA